jgi:hypothetical protein
MSRCPFPCVSERKRHHWVGSVERRSGWYASFCNGCGCRQYTSHDFSKVVYGRPREGHERHGWKARAFRFQSRLWFGALAAVLTACSVDSFTATDADPPADAQAPDVIQAELKEAGSDSPDASDPPDVLDAGQDSAPDASCLASITTAPLACGNSYSTPQCTTRDAGYACPNYGDPQGYSDCMSAGSFYANCTGKSDCGGIEVCCLGPATLAGSCPGTLSAQGSSGLSAVCEVPSACGVGSRLLCRSDGDCGDAGTCHARMLEGFSALSGVVVGVCE